MPTFYEFFAGGGMARAGLGADWSCLFANDFDRKKAESYQANWGCANELLVADIANITTSMLPGHADLAWASFPCQDLSLAGDYRGLAGKRSGTFWTFWKLIEKLIAEGRAPRTIVIENVCGALTSHGGKDFQSIVSAFAHADYKFGAIVIDARHWVPQSRPRLFIIAACDTVTIPLHLSDQPTDVWHTRAVRNAHLGLTPRIKKRWVWWKMPIPARRNISLSAVIEDLPTGIGWHSEQETRHILNLMTSLNRKKVQAVVEDTKAIHMRKIGGIYRRTRTGQQRAEVRFDDIAGCLRTPAGGSSRQTIVVVENGAVKSRLLSPREAARLMGLPDTYILPSNYNQAYHLLGDGVVVPCVRHLAENILEPLLINDTFAAVAAE